MTRYGGNIIDGPLKDGSLESDYPSVLVPIRVGPDVGPGERGFEQVAYIWSEIGWKVAPAQRLVGISDDEIGPQVFDAWS